MSQVVYLGEKRTRKSLIAKTVGIGPEAPLSQGKLLEAESELYNLGVFDWSSVGPRRPITTQQDEEAVVKVHESKRNAITYGFGLEISRRGGNIPSGTLAVPGKRRLFRAKRLSSAHAAQWNSRAAISAAWARRGQYRFCWRDWINV